MYFARILMIAFAAGARANVAPALPKPAGVADAVAPAVADAPAVGPGLRGSATEATSCCNYYNEVAKKCILPTCVPCVNGAMKLPGNKKKAAGIQGCATGYACGNLPMYNIGGAGCESAGKRLAQCARVGSVDCKSRAPVDCNKPPASGRETWSIKGSKWTDKACFQVNFASQPDAGCMVKWAQGSSRREDWGSSWKSGSAWEKDLERKPCTSRGFDSDENEGCKFHPHNGCLYD